MLEHAEAEERRRRFILDACISSQMEILWSREMFISAEIAHTFLFVTIFFSCQVAAN